MAKDLEQMKAYALRLKKDLDSLLEGKGLGYNSIERLFNNISSCSEKRSALTYLEAIRERVQKIIYSLESADNRGKQEPRYKGLYPRLKPFLVRIDAFMSEC